MTMKSIEGFKTAFLTSGKDVIAYSYGLRLGFFLYLRSPIALDKLRLPSILPSAVMT